MYICPNCKAEHEQLFAFCSVCGNKMDASNVVIEEPAAQPIAEQPVAEPQAPIYQQPIEQPIYQQPMYQQPPVPHNIDGKLKAKGFVGMGLSIGGVVMAAIGFLYTAITIAVPVAGFMFGLIFSMFALPLSIVGMILSRKAIAGGFVSGATKVGKILGLIGTIAGGVVLLMAFISLGVADSYTPSPFDGYDYY